MHPQQLVILLSAALALAGIGASGSPESAARAAGNPQAGELRRVTHPGGGQGLPATSAAERDFRYTRLSGPARTVVTDASGAWVATFTDGARTVALAGPERTFAERAHTDATVTHNRWVRLLDAPFRGEVDEAWLEAAQADARPDILGLAMQYVLGAPERFDEAGALVAGDADYGPRQADGSREEGADFNDYLGVDWRYARRPDRNEARQLGALDCSGYVRMVFGYRGGMPLSRGMNGGESIPRRAVMQAQEAPGVPIIRNDGRKATGYRRLQEGDLVFFDVSSNDGADIDHVGIYLGRDSQGNFRFISSRKKANGPTLGDHGGRSLLNPVDGTGYYAAGFRAARRL